MLRVLKYAGAQDLISRKTVRLAEAERAVTPILEAVRNRADAAVLEYARKFDAFEGPDVRVPAGDIQAARQKLSPEFLSAVDVARCNIREYAATQLPCDRLSEYPDGRKLGHIVRPLESMGAYIPAGRYPLPSTLLMTVVPAQVAGVRRIA